MKMDETEDLEEPSSACHDFLDDTITFLADGEDGIIQLDEQQHIVSVDEDGVATILGTIHVPSGLIVPVPADGSQNSSSDSFNPILLLDKKIILTQPDTDLDLSKILSSKEEIVLDELPKEVINGENTAEKLSRTSEPGFTKLSYMKVNPKSSCPKLVAPSSKKKPLIRIHSGEKLYKCGFDFCGKGFKTSSELLRHVTIHSGERPFTCEQPGCGRTFASTSNFKNHMKTHSSDKNKLFASSKDGVQRRKRHTIYPCTLEGCPKSFSSPFSRKAHMRVHTGEKPYKCSYDFCVKGFKTSGDLLKHTRTHTGERPFKCNVEGCNKAFTTGNILQVHTRSHTGERPFICDKPECGRKFASSSNYRNHMRIHSGEKPFACNVEGCGKRFTEYSSLYKHQTVHNQQARFSCTMCDKSYRQQTSLVSHIKTAHTVAAETIVEDSNIESLTSIINQNSIQELLLKKPLDVLVSKKENLVEVAERIDSSPLLIVNSDFLPAIELVECELSGSFTID